MKDKFNYMSPQKFEEIIRAIPLLKIRKWSDRDVEMLFRICYWCGLRPSEGIFRKKEDFDLDNREVYLGKTKTKDIDYGVIPAQFVTELTEYLNMKGPGRLLQGLTYTTFVPWLRKLGKICDVPAWITPQSVSHEKTLGHIFRKSVGKDMLTGMYGEKAREIPVISKHLRHAKPSTTMDHYLKGNIETVKEAW